MDRSSELRLLMKTNKSYVTNNTSTNNNSSNVLSGIEKAKLLKQMKEKQKQSAIIANESNSTNKISKSNDNKLPVNFFDNSESIPKKSTITTSSLKNIDKRVSTLKSLPPKKNNPNSNISIVQENL